MFPLASEIAALSESMFLPVFAEVPGIFGIERITQSRSDKLVSNYKSLVRSVVVFKARHFLAREAEAIQGCIRAAETIQAFLSNCRDNQCLDDYLTIGQFLGEMTLGEGWKWWRQGKEIYTGKGTGDEMKGRGKGREESGNRGREERERKEEIQRGER